MFTLAPFAQKQILDQQKIICNNTRYGVCVALCDHWLALVREGGTTAEARMAQLAEPGRFAKVMGHQRIYQHLRNRDGRATARKAVGAQVGIVYDRGEKTSITERSFGAEQHPKVLVLGVDALQACLREDLRGFFQGATWTLRFRGGGGHAIAGFCSLRSPTNNFHVQHLHIFDPNLGEYEGGWGDLLGMLGALMGPQGIYHDVVEIHRTGVGDIQS